MLIDLTQLRTFVVVAEEQHLTRAAERLHISLSAASAHVRAVEETLGTQLFVRTNRSLELTRAGRLMLAKGKALLNEAALFTSFAREVQGKVEGQLMVGSSSEPSCSRVGEIIGALHTKHPLICVNLLARPSSSMRQELHNGELDIGLLLGGPVDTEFACYELTKLQFRVAGPAAWKEQIESADWAYLASLPWVTPTDSSMAFSTMLQLLFEQRGLRLNSVSRFDNAALGRAMVEAGVGLMLMREDHAREGVERGVLAASAIAHIEVPLYIAHLASRRTDPLIGGFLEAAADAWSERTVAPWGADAALFSRSSYCAT